MFSRQPPSGGADRLARTMTVAGLIAVAALSRVIPHPPNFTPLTAAALFGGACLARRWQAFLVPLAALFLSDLVLGVATRLLHVYAGWLRYPSGPFYDGWWVIYLAMAAVVGVGLLLRGRRSVLTVATAALAGSTLFFLVSNFAVWAAGGLYPRTAAGLGACFTSAIPFWVNEQWWQSPLFGDLLYSSILFGAFALAERRVPALRPALPPALEAQAG